LKTGRRALLLLLLTAGLLLSGLLLLAHHGEGPAVSAVASVCGEGKESGCALVNRSPYSTVGGVPWAAVGLVFYGSLGLLVALGFFAEPAIAEGADGLATGCLALAVAIDLLLLGVQAFALKAYCVLCLTTYAINLVSFVVLLPFRPPSAALKLPSRDGRLLLAGWLLGSAAVVAAAFAGEKALSLREVARAPEILGQAPQKDAPAGTAEAEVQRLHGILDDPLKLDAYLNEKASKDFDEAPVRNLDLGGVPARGPEGAPIRVVDYSDFLCPFCRQAAQGFAAWLPQSAGRVVLYYKNFPLDMTCNDRAHATVHPGACFLALGGICAQDQGKFWAYHDKVFNAQNLQNPTAKDVTRLASEAGLDGQALGVCIDSAGARSRLTAQIHEGADAGVQSTPTLFINGRKLPRIDHFLESVEKESRRLGLPPLASPKP
jgi:protein-disulfide isomerase/uncharacterized membrane protein